MSPRESFPPTLAETAAEPRDLIDRPSKWRQAIGLLLILFFGLYVLFWLPIQWVVLVGSDTRRSEMWPFVFQIALPGVVIGTLLAVVWVGSSRWIGGAIVVFSVGIGLVVPAWSVVEDPRFDRHEAGERVREVVDATVEDLDLDVARAAMSEEEGCQRGMGGGFSSSYRYGYPIGEPEVDVVDDFDQYQELRTSVIPYWEENAPEWVDEIRSSGPDGIYYDDLWFGLRDVPGSEGLSLGIAGETPCY